MPAPNLVDLGVAADTVHFGRERRHQYWTLPIFRAFLTKENLPFDKKKRAILEAIDFTHAGAFTSFESDEFYDGTDPSSLNTFVDNFNRNQQGPPKKLGRPRKHPLPTGDMKEPRKRGRPPKRKAEEALASGDEKPTPRKRDRAKKPVAEADPAAPPSPKKRGRPSKADLAARAVQLTEDAASQQAPTKGDLETKPTPKKRAPPKSVGRAPKAIAVPAAGSLESIIINDNSTAGPSSKSPTSGSSPATTLVPDSPRKLNPNLAIEVPMPQRSPRHSDVPPEVTRGPPGISVDSNPPIMKVSSAELIISVYSSN